MWSRALSRWLDEEAAKTRARTRALDATRGDILAVAQYAKTHGDGEVWQAACRLLNRYADERGKDMKQPEVLTYQELADILQEMADLVRRGDSLEGSIEYLLPGPYAEGEPEPAPDAVEVTASYRVGNTAGQGGMRMIGHIKLQE